MVVAVSAYSVPSGSSGSLSSASSGASMNGGYGTKAEPVEIISSTNEANEDGIFKYTGESKYLKSHSLILNKILKIYNEIVLTAPMALK